LSLFDFVENKGVFLLLPFFGFMASSFLSLSVPVFFLSELFIYTAKSLSSSLFG